MAFDGDAPIGCVALDDIGDLINFRPAVTRKIRAVELEVYVGQIDHDAAARLFRLDVSFFQLFDQSTVFFNFAALLVDRLLLCLLLVLLP